MNPEMVMDMGKQALMIALIVTAPPLLAGLIVGLAVSVFQATTQIQDMTLTFLPKLIAGILAVIIAAPWMMNHLLTYTHNILSNLGQFVK
jgi:flagellar biosynthetic protein FliQ